MFILKYTKPVLVIVLTVYTKSLHADYSRTHTITLFDILKVFFKVMNEGNFDLKGRCSTN